MMREILLYIEKGKMTLSQIAREMGLEREELHSRVHMLERSGYIEEASLAGKECDEKCTSCPVSSYCHDDSTNPRYLTLTEKGRRYLFSSGMRADE